jgi:hypothetical protein
MAYDPEEMIPFRGKLITQEAIFHKVKGLGWNTRMFGTLSPERMVQVLEQRMTPAQAGVTPEAVAAAPPASGPIDLDAVGEDPSIMGASGPAPIEQPASGIVAETAPPPSPNHLRPVDPTRTRLTPIQPQAAVPAAVPVPAAKPIVIRPPKVSADKLMPMLDAGFQLAQTDAMASTAKTLISANNLIRPFQVMYPELAKKVFGRIDMTPDEKCRGGVVLEVEIDTDAGYAHIITSAGTITLTGVGISQHSTPNETNS